MLPNYPSMSTTGSNPMLFPSQMVSKDSLTPYSDATQSKKKKLNHVNRPMNAFMVWSQIERKKQSEVTPDKHNATISKELGASWKQLTDEERLPFQLEAKILAEFHRKEYPTYKYQPKKKKKNTTLPKTQIKKELGLSNNSKKSMGPKRTTKASSVHSGQQSGGVHNNQQSSGVNTTLEGTHKLSLLIPNNNNNNNHHTHNVHHLHHNHHSTSSVLTPPGIVPTSPSGIKPASPEGASLYLETHQNISQRFNEVNVKDEKTNGFQSQQQQNCWRHVETAGDMYVFETRATWSASSSPQTSPSASYSSALTPSSTVSSPPPFTVSSPPPSSSVSSPSHVAFSAQKQQQESTTYEELFDLNCLEVQVDVSDILRHGVTEDRDSIPLEDVFMEESEEAYMDTTADSDPSIEYFPFPFPVSTTSTSSNMATSSTTFCMSEDVLFSASSSGPFSGNCDDHLLSRMASSPEASSTLTASRTVTSTVNQASEYNKNLLEQKRNEKKLAVIEAGL